MNKILLQAFLILAFFVAVLFGLRQINWMKVFSVEKNTERLADKLGDFYWGVLGGQESEIKHKNLSRGIDSLISKICTSNKIDKTSIKVHVFKNDEVNAFALPGRRLVIYSGLIQAAENQEELAGVMSHELAHIELNHVMKKLISEVGLSTLISITAGGGGSETAKSMVKLLTSTSFDRSLEREADIKAVDYLTEAGIDPEPFANFLFRLSAVEVLNAQVMAWMSTHPDSEERGIYIIEHSKDLKKEYKRVISEEGWKEMQEIVRGVH